MCGTLTARGKYSQSHWPTVSFNGQLLIIVRGFQFTMDSPCTSPGICTNSNLRRPSYCFHGHLGDLLFSTEEHKTMLDWRPRPYSLIWSTLLQWWEFYKSYGVPMRRSWAQAQSRKALKHSLERPSSTVLKGPEQLICVRKRHVQK